MKANSAALRSDEEDERDNTFEDDDDSEDGESYESTDLAIENVIDMNNPDRDLATLVSTICQ